MESGTRISDRITQNRRARDIGEHRRNDRLGFYDELNVGPCVLVSRELGAGGGEIASKLAQRLEP